MAQTSVLTSSSHKDGDIMALKVWLPLNGNLENIGCSGAVATNNGAAIDSSGKIGNCYSFDGNDDFISIQDTTVNSIFSGSTQPFSISMWVYHNDSTRGVLFGDYGLTGAINFNIELSTEHKIRFYWNGSPDITSSSFGIGLQSWAHIAITYNGSKITFYLNGNENYLYTASLAVKNKTSGAYYIGRDSRTGTTAFNGKLNDVRIYDHCLSIKEVKEISRGLVLHYKLDDLTHGVQDSSGYNNNGTTLNTVTTNSDTARYSASTNLTTGNAMINCGRGGMVTDSITVNFWLKSSAWANPISCTEGGGWNFEASGDYFRFPVYISGVGYKYGQSTTTKAELCNNQWHMLTGIYNRKDQQIKIYVDGELDNEYDTGTSNIIGYNGNNVIWLGAEAGGTATEAASNGMIGLFSDLRIYCTALPQIEIDRLYKLGASTDNKQNIHTFEVVENQSAIKLTRQGQFKCKELNETTKASIKKNKDITANYLIEL